MKKYRSVTFLSLMLLTTNVMSVQLPFAVQFVKNTLEQKKLLSSPTCTDYINTPDFEPDVDSVDVIEKHGGGCPGDPQVQHRLFTVNVNKKTHEMTSDINDPGEPEFSAFPAK